MAAAARSRRTPEGYDRDLEISSPSLSPLDEIGKYGPASGLLKISGARLNGLIFLSLLGCFVTTYVIFQTTAPHVKATANKVMATGSYYLGGGGAAGYGDGPKGPPKLIDAGSFADWGAQARASARGRMNFNFHDDSPSAAPDPLQRMINVWTRGSYSQPHTHREPMSLLVLEGTAAVFIFGANVEGAADGGGGADTGKLVACHLLGPKLGKRGIDVPAGVWMTMTGWSEETPAVVWETKLKPPGAYDPKTAKIYASYAPAGPAMGEAPSKEAVAYLAGLIAKCAEMNEGGGQ